MFLGHNTNGFAHHRLEDTVEILGKDGGGQFDPQIVGLLLDHLDEALSLRG